MKPLLRAVALRPAASFHPLHRHLLPLFFVLAFLPCFLRLTFAGLPAVLPLAAIGPMAAGFWLAAALRETRVHSVALGGVTAGLLWLANWVMFAGGVCCQTYN